MVMRPNSPLIAITADVHVRPDRPERLAALRSILEDCLRRGIRHLIVAGDLFDAGQSGYKDVDALLREDGIRQIEIHVIPGNHDPDTRRAIFSADVNLVVHSSPESAVIAGRSFLFLPWERNAVASAVLDRIGARARREVKDTVLVMHGDVVGSPVDGGEEGDDYYPVTPQDAEEFGFPRVLIGHIHKPGEPCHERFIYPGSPCPLSHKETGPRRYILLDSRTLVWSAAPVPGVTTWEDVNVFLVPSPDASHIAETRRIIARAAERLASRPAAAPLSRVRPIVRFSGFTAEPIAALQTAAEDECRRAGFNLEFLARTDRLEQRPLSSTESRIVSSLAEQLDAEYPSYPADQFAPTRERILASAITLILPAAKKKAGG